MFEKTLIISPHFDDETIGCGGLISSVVSSCHNELRIVVVATSNLHNYSAGRIVTNDERKKECINALSRLGVLYPEKVLIHLEGFEDGRLDQCDRKELVTELDEVILDFKPTAVLFPYSSHHQDHQTVYQASISALRPTVTTNFIRLKCMYEYPYINSWSSSINPNSKLYFPLGEREVEMKREALKSYKSQLDRDSRDILSIDSIMNLAKVRGTEIGVDYAECFYPMTIIL